jgi:hypothetical protein
MKIRMRHWIAACAALGLAAAWTDAAAQTLYKLIDKNGKVTYSESPPKNFDGQVIRMDIDPKANTATLPKPGAAARPETESEKVLRRPSPSTAGGGDKAQAARDKLDAARKALQNAIDNPGEGDVQRVGNKGGFTRPVPTEEYQKRIAGLEENVKRAEEELRVAEGR